MKRNNVQFLVPEKDCTGCSACLNACPHDSIFMAENSNGHILPKVNQDTCSDCGYCAKICPSLRDVDVYTPIKTYAGWILDIDEHLTCTSGGVATILAKHIIANSGVVYGCTSCLGNEIKHIRVTTTEGIDKLKGSKYVQSNIHYIFRQIKDDLKELTTVLFIGTPCQVAGLKNYLNSKYSNLITVALVCHGVPPQKILYDHISGICGDLNDIKLIKFREQGRDKYTLSIETSKGVIYKKTIFEDLYYSAFNDCLTMRESCVNCKYACVQRCEDITLGDFHQIGTKIPFNFSVKGNISLILANTKSGLNILSNISRNALELHERTLEEALEGNPQLQVSSKRRANYKLFTTLYPLLGFKSAARIVLWRRLMKNLIIRNIIRNRLWCLIPFLL